MPTPVPSNECPDPGVGSRPLDRAVLVQTAVEHVERYGVHGLTMRRLGQELGVEVMAVYRHVSGRRDLLDAVIARLLEDIREDVARQPARSWQRYLQILADAVRTIATDHPAAFPLIAFHPAPPWLCPPLSSLGLVEDVLSTLVGHGVTDDKAVQIYRAFSAFLLGQLLLESRVRDADTAADQEWLAGGAEHRQITDGQIDAAASPTVFRLRDSLARTRRSEEFEATLEILLQRLAPI